MKTFRFGETKDPYGFFAYKVQNERPTGIFFWFAVPFWFVIFLTVLCFLCLGLGLAVTFTDKETSERIGDLISRWKAVDDWFFNRNCPT